MVVAVVATAGRRMDRDVHGALVARSDFGGQRAGEASAFVALELTGQRDLELAGDGRVLARLGEFSGIPQLRTIPRPRRRVVGHDDLAVQDAAFARVVVHETGAFVLDARGGTIRRGGGGTATVRAADRLH